MTRCSLLIFILSLQAATTVALVSPPLLKIRSRSRIPRSDGNSFRLSAIGRRKKGKIPNARNNDDIASALEEDPSSPSLLTRLTGLAFPLVVAVAANAPFLYVIAKPPSAEEREVMLMDFCKGDVCTLLGGGSGFVGEDAGGAPIDAEMAQAMPSAEDFEAMARIAAEALTGAADVL